MNIRKDFDGLQFTQACASGKPIALRKDCFRARRRLVLEGHGINHLHCCLLVGASVLIKMLKTAYFILRALFRPSGENVLFIYTGKNLRLGR